MFFAVRLFVCRLKNSPIVVFGRSLGGAVSFYLAEKFPSEVAAVIVENTFLSISAMVDIVMPFLRPIKPYVLRIKWDSDEKISRVKQPILFISGYHRFCAGYVQKHFNDVCHFLCR